MADNLRIVINVQALVERAAIELDVPPDRLLTLMVLDCLGDQTDDSRSLQNSAYLARVVPAGAEQLNVPDIHKIIPFRNCWLPAVLTNQEAVSPAQAELRAGG